MFQTGYGKVSLEAYSEFQWCNTFLSATPQLLDEITIAFRHVSSHPNRISSAREVKIVSTSKAYSFIPYTDFVK